MKTLRKAEVELKTKGAYKKKRVVSRKNETFCSKIQKCQNTIRKQPPELFFLKKSGY